MKKFTKVIEIYKTHRILVSELNVNDMETVTKVEPIFESYDEYVRPNFIRINLKDGRKLEIHEKRIKGGKAMYQQVLMLFDQNRFDILNKLISAMITNLNK